MKLFTAPPSATTQSAIPNGRSKVDSQKLFQGAPTVEIEHAGQTYFLRVTRENKLILTK